MRIIINRQLNGKQSVGLDKGNFPHLFTNGKQVRDFLAWKENGNICVETTLDNLATLKAKIEKFMEEN